MATGIYLITTVVGFGMSVTFIIFVCTRLICGRMSAPESRPMFDTQVGSEPDQSFNGLEAVIVASFPTMKFSREAFDTEEDTQCSICLGEYQEKERLRIMPTCGHNFHITCIDTWLQNQSTCPVCRSSLRDPLGAKYTRSPMFRTIVQPVDSSEVSSEQSYQWLLPGQERSSGTESIQGQDGSVSRNIESTSAGTENGR